jgi:hypothetical protein
VYFSSPSRRPALVVGATPFLSRYFRSFNHASATANVLPCPSASSHFAFKPRLSLITRKFFAARASSIALSMAGQCVNVQASNFYVSSRRFGSYSLLVPCRKPFL